MQRYFSKTPKDSYFILDDKDIHHITNVMRMQDGDKIKVVYEKELYLCEIKFENRYPNIKIIEKKRN